MFVKAPPSAFHSRRIMFVLVARLTTRIQWCLDRIRASLESAGNIVFISYLLLHARRLVNRPVRQLCRDLVGPGLAANSLYLGKEKRKMREPEAQIENS